MNSEYKIDASSIINVQLLNNDNSINAIINAN